MPDDRTAYLTGAYEMCALLLTSPRFNRSQREVIEGEAYRIKDELEKAGVTFEQREDQQSRPSGKS